MSKLFIKNKFGQTPVDLLNRSDISLNAKGIFAYLQSKPDAWDFKMKNMVNQLKEGIKAVRSAIKELEESGYLIRENKQNNKGQWETDYYLYVEPTKAKPLTSKNKPHTLCGNTGKGYTLEGYTPNGNTLDKKNLDKKNSKKDIVTKKINKKEKVSSEDILDINLKELIKLRTELLQEPIESSRFADFKRSQDQVWDEDKAKASIESILDSIELWMTDNARKLSARPNVKARFKQFAKGSDIGWIYPSKNSQTLVKSKIQKPQEYVPDGVGDSITLPHIDMRAWRAEMQSKANKNTN